MTKYKLAVIAIATGILIGYFFTLLLNNRTHTKLVETVVNNEASLSNQLSSQPNIIKKITVSHHTIQRLLSYDKSSLLQAAVEAQPQLTASFALIMKQCPSTQVQACIKLFSNLIPKKHPSELKNLLVNLYRFYLADQLLNADQSPKKKPLIANSLEEILGDELTQSFQAPQTSSQLTSLFRHLEDQSLESEQYQQTLTKIESLLDESLSKQESLAAELKLLEQSANKDEQELFKQAKAIQAKYYASNSSVQNSQQQKLHKEYQQQELILLAAIDQQYPNLLETEKQRLIAKKLAELRAKIYYPAESNRPSNQ
ncbi:hypothetical protein [Spartinivicinus ruber]|uniref:hypothetical protein n=1 Tax=Spartinivicinus ruber TaxID=2683272 RepID=UPI0013D30909|nr:hypothetical protein [Spartinivicinus ruber]